MQRKMIVLVMGLFLLILGGTGVAAAADQQVIGQAAGSSQTASSTATSTQESPSNQNIDVRIFSPGDAGAVTQTNSSAAAALAANGNDTDQSAQQQQAGGSGATQAVGQDAASTQTASSDATSTQTHPSNTNIAVRIDSPGNGGAVEQTNSSAAGSAALNKNDTDQSANQQHGGGACCGTGGATQAVGQKARSTQDADSTATSTQTHPSNTNIAVRIGSSGNNGAVTQSNSSTAAALAANGNDADQSATQQQAGGACCGAGGGTQAVGQGAWSHQSATSNATSSQDKPSNTNIPVRIGSPGDDGQVTQTNASVALSAALNHNDTDQTATQTQGGGTCCAPGTGVQAIGQKADSDQTATSDATSTQDHPSNTNTPVRIKSYGDDGSVTQTNLSLAGSLAANHNDTDQTATQTQGGSSNCCTPPTRMPLTDTNPCCHGGTGVQAIGQFADSDQTADSSADARQTAPCNFNGPVRESSPGTGGSVEQSNGSLAGSLALNGNWLTQYAAQQQGGVT